MCIFMSYVLKCGGMGYASVLITLTIIHTFRKWREPMMGRQKWNNETIWVYFPVDRQLEVKYQ